MASEGPDEMDELAWDGYLAASGDALADLADEALAEHRSGRTRPFDADEQ